MIKHGTSSVFLFGKIDGQWRIGLILHPRLHRWMLPGGHVEADENPAEAALREVREETGLTVRLLDAPGAMPTTDPGVVPSPLWIVEQTVPPEKRTPEAHIHIDHLYVGVTLVALPAEAAELRYAWYLPDQLCGLRMFDTTRTAAYFLFDRIDELAAANTRASAGPLNRSAPISIDAALGDALGGGG